MRCRTAGALHKFTEYKKKKPNQTLCQLRIVRTLTRGRRGTGGIPSTDNCALVHVNRRFGFLVLCRWQLVAFPLRLRFFLLVVLKDGRIFDFITSDNDAHKSRSSSSTDGLPDRRSWTRQRIQFDWIEASRICVYDLPVEGCLLASHWRKSDWESRNGQRVCNGCYLSLPLLPFSFISRPLSCILNAPPLA